MSDPHFKIRIARDGSIQIDAVNFTGEACLKKLDELFAGLGTEIARETKPEYYAHPQESTQWLTTKD